MRPAAEVMAELAASGLSPVQIALVMELSATVAAEARPVEDKAAQRRRERDRQYQAERRQSRQISADSDDSPCPLTPPLKSTPDPTKITPPISPKPTTELRARRLPADWKPEPVIGKAADMLARWPPGEIERELAKFRNYWLAKAGKDACKINWQRTWINWLISADERKPNGGSPNGTGKQDRGPTREVYERFGLGG